MEENFPRVQNDAVSSRGRRSLLKGAAWSVPVVALASATPAAAASGGTPTCPSCLKPGVLVDVVTSQAVVVNGRGALAFAGVFGLDSRGCDLTLFRPLYTVLPTSATLTMSNGASYKAIGLAAGTGTFGQLGALPGTLLFSDIAFPRGNYGGASPFRPVALTVTANVILVGLPSLIEITCPVTLNWNLTLLATGAVVGVSDSLSAGTINYTGTAAPIV
ncbi:MULTISPECIES: hypothetical protein [unclassified Rathayibacter]|uniref:hypothetical protein n=1 Tax=unclassified Rathayibacter TaxID=2609250 RepID=UPI00188B95FB|nr:MULTISPECIES: hypothetical protein [unclassified Rathayibacter]MBF4461252.1 hypothetical protein [Rathayibacter sp. VKM Ac-2879]MBF4502663.1 hypothetical protein [Rathayibacter sp. VKM Ac-2878]